MPFVLLWGGERATPIARKAFRTASHSPVKGASGHLPFRPSLPSFPRSGAFLSVVGRPLWAACGGTKGMKEEK